MITKFSCLSTKSQPGSTSTVRAKPSMPPVSPRMKWKSPPSNKFVWDPSLTVHEESYGSRIGVSGKSG